MLHALVATSFVTETAQVCTTPFASPETVMGDAEPAAVTRPPLTVVHRAVYEEMVPPLAVAPVNATVTEPPPGVALTDVGGDGIPTAITAAESDDGSERPAALVEETAQV